MTKTEEPAAPNQDQPRRPRTWRWWVAGGLAVAIVVAMGRRLCCDVHDGEEQALQSTHWDGKPRFVETTYPTYGRPANASLLQRLWFAYYDFQTRHGKKNPMTHTFGATPVRPCSVHGLLNQCMTVTGTRYLIATEAAAGAVQFGHTNTLNGAQWVAAFEAVLQTNQPDCFDYNAKRPRRENLLFIREKSGVVKVIPPSRLVDYQKAGLVDPSYLPPAAPKP